jgi:predicted  nucleic acid-binding Zn-ribbon protein
MQVAHLRESGAFLLKDELRFDPYAPSSVTPTEPTVRPRAPPSSNLGTLISAAQRLKSGVSNQTYEVISSAFSRFSDGMKIALIYKRWQVWAARRALSRRFLQFLQGTLSTVFRKEYFRRWRENSRSKKMHRQMHNSSQMAAKSETLVGDLVTENTILREEISQLRIRVETLENASRKRLSSLTTSSENAIHQIRVLTAENQQKEEVIQKLEQRMMSIGNLMLAAHEEKQQVLEATAAAKVKLEDENEALRQRIANLEESIRVQDEKLDAWRPKPKPAQCVHCEHYFQLESECDVLRRNAEGLRQRIKDLDQQRQRLIESVQLMKGSNGPRSGGTPTNRRQSTPDRSSVSSDAPPPPPDYDSDELNHSESGSGTFEPPQQGTDFHKPLIALAPVTPPLSSAALEPSQSFALPMHGSYQMPAALNASKLDSFAFGSMSSVPQRSAAAALLQEGGQPNLHNESVLPAGDSRTRTDGTVDLSLESFFSKEERYSSERMRLALERQTQVRLRTGGFASAVPGIGTSQRANVPEREVPYILQAQQTPQFHRNFLAEDQLRRQEERRNMGEKQMAATLRGPRSEYARGTVGDLQGTPAEQTEAFTVGTDPFQRPRTVASHSAFSVGKPVSNSVGMRHRLMQS